jgi:transcriptional regulator
LIEAIGKELKVLRIRNNLSIEEVANNFGLSYETIRRYENGSVDMSIERLEDMLKYYKIDADIFFKNVCANNHN